MLHAYIDFYWLYSAPATLFVSLSCRVQTSVPCPMGHRVTRISTAHICGAMPEVIRKEDEVKVMEPAFEKWASPTDSSAPPSRAMRIASSSQARRNFESEV